MAKVGAFALAFESSSSSSIVEKAALLIWGGVPKEDEEDVKRAVAVWAEDFSAASACLYARTPIVKASLCKCAIVRFDKPSESKVGVLARVGSSWAMIRDSLLGFLGVSLGNYSECTDDCRVGRW